MEKDDHPKTENESEDFASMLDQMPVNFDIGREEIRPCRSFPKGAAILMRQNGQIIFALELGKIRIEFARGQLDKDEAQVWAVSYARSFEKGIIPIEILNCLVQ